MMTGLAYWLRNIALGAALAYVWSGAALSQQSGTVLRETLTLLGSTAATMEIDVAGPKTANTETDLLLEFGPDGNSSTHPVPDPQLAATTTFMVSASFGGSRSFMPSGGTETGGFADKIVAFAPQDPANAPGLYVLSIIHLKDIPAGVTETWKVLISGLPGKGLRAVASVRQGTFRSLSPTGASQGPPAIIPEPLFMAGTAPALTVRSSGGLDLSQAAPSQVAVAPPDGISILGVSNATPDSAVVSFSIAKCAAGGERTLTIRGQSGLVSMLFLIEAPGPPAISITPDQAVTIPSTAMLNVTSTGCLDLSGVTKEDVSIDPLDGISGLSVGNVAPGSAVVSFDIANCAPPGARTLTIRKQDISASTGFVLAARQPGIGVTPGQVELSSSVTLNVTSIGCFSLAGVTQVSIDPPDGLSNLTIGAASATSLTLSFDVASDARLGDHRLVIVNGGASAVAAFDVVRPRPPPPPPRCPPGQHSCCEPSGTGSGETCSCVPIAQHCT